MAYRDVVLADNPLSYWRLGETTGTNAVDEQGVNALTYSGTFTLNQTGMLTNDANKSVRLDAASLGKVASVSALAQAGDWSLDAWINPDSITGTRGLAGSTENGGTFRQNYLLLVDDAVPGIQYGEGTYPKASGGTIAIGVTAYLAAIYVDATKRLTLYLNGAEVAGATGAAEAPSAGCTFAIGALNAGTSNGYSGFIDEVAVYPSALSTARVLAHYNAGKDIDMTSKSALPGMFSPQLAKEAWF